MSNSSVYFLIYFHPRENKATGVFFSHIFSFRLPSPCAWISSARRESGAAGRREDGTDGGLSEASLEISRAGHCYYRGQGCEAAAFVASKTPPPIWAKSSSVLFLPSVAKIQKFLMIFCPAAQYKASAGPTLREVMSVWARPANTLLLYPPLPPPFRSFFLLLLVGSQYLPRPPPPLPQHIYRKKGKETNTKHKND